MRGPVSCAGLPGRGCGQRITYPSTGLRAGQRDHIFRDAEQRLREPFGTRVVQGRREVDQFLGLWRLLWVKQGGAGVAPHADLNDDARARLRDVLASQVNEVAAGPLGERIVARAAAERARYWTPTWK